MFEKTMAEKGPNLMKTTYLKLKQVLHLKMSVCTPQTKIKVLVVEVAHCAL